MAQLLQGSLKFSMATTAVAIMFYYCGAVILAMQLPTAKVSAHFSHHGPVKASQSATTVVPQNITLFSYSALQGANSTTGYNTAQCSGPRRSQPNGFAVTFCFDMPLLLKQDLSSQLLGMLQGTYVFISLGSNQLFVSQTFSLNTSTTPRGSFTATGVQSTGQVSSKPVTGGTDAFAFLAGVVRTTPLISSSNSSSSSNGTSTVGSNNGTSAVDSNGNDVSWFKFDVTFRPASH